MYAKSSVDELPGFVCVENRRGLIFEAVDVLVALARVVKDVVVVRASMVIVVEVWSCRRGSCSDV